MLEKIKDYLSVRKKNAQLLKVLNQLIINGQIEEAKYHVSLASLNENLTLMSRMVTAILLEVGGSVLINKETIETVKESDMDFGANSNEDGSVTLSLYDKSEQPNNS